MNPQAHEPMKEESFIYDFIDITTAAVGILALLVVLVLLFLIFVRVNRIMQTVETVLLKRVDDWEGQDEADR